MSPSPPLRKSGKDAPSRPVSWLTAYILTYSPRLPILWDSGFSSRISLPFTVARAVAVLHRSSRSPLAHRVFKRRGCRERSALLQSFPCQVAGLQQVGLVYAAGIDGMGRGGELDSKNTNALDLLCRRSRAS